MPNYKFEDRNEQRLRGMQAFDRAAAAEDRVSLASERLQLQRDRDETNRAFREAESAAKAEQRASELGLRERIVSGRESQFAVANELTRTRQQLEADKLEFQKAKELREAELAKELNPLTLEKKKLDLERDAALFKGKQIRDARTNEADTGFNQHMSELHARGADPDELKAGFLIGKATFPFVSHEALKDWGETLFRKPNGEPMTAEEMTAEMNALRAAHPDAKISVTQKGGATVSTDAVPPALKTEASRLDKEYFSEVAAWNAYKKAHGEDSNPGNEEKIKELRTKRDEVGAQIHALSNPAPAQASTANPRAALAQKALDDPNASEAHKAAARKILGIP